MVNALPTSNESGQRFRSSWYYSNAAFGVLGMVVRAASGIRYSDSFRQRLLEPLGLSRTLVLEADDDSNDNIAHPYVQLADGKWSRIKTRATSEKHAPALARACGHTKLCERHVGLSCGCYESTMIQYIPRASIAQHAIGGSWSHFLQLSPLHE